jgi:predicted dehydrogenase
MTLRIGILGAARVATYALIGAAKDVDGVSAHAVAARDPRRAAAYAAEHGIPSVYPDYQALINAPDVDAVYNALPPNLHAKWSIAAAEAGKPVLCEKPFALSVSDVEAMLEAEARTGALIMEAQHSHYHPLSARMRAVVQSGVLGSIHTVAAVFDAPVDKSPGEIRYMPGVGGGALWDLGVYAAYWLRSAMGAEPNVLRARQRCAPTGADVATTADLRFADGAVATLACNMDAPFAASIRFEGNRGALMITNPLAPQAGHRFELTTDGRATEEQFDRRSSYAFQLDAFRDAILHGTPVPTRGADSLATIRLLSAVQNAAVKE